MFRSILRFTIACFAACTLMVSLGCGDVKPDADATGDGAKTTNSADKNSAAEKGGAAKAD